MTVDQAAAALWEASRTKQPCAPVRTILPVDDAWTAYEVARINVARAELELGYRRSGYKIGLTSVAVQRQLGVDQPDFGVLFEQLGHSDGATVPFDSLLQPRVDAEVALILADDLRSEKHTIAQVANAVEYVVPALEIVDSRIAGWDISLVDTIADNGSAGDFVLGGVPVELDTVDLEGVEMSMSLAGREVSSGRGSDCLGHPLLAAAWLADRMVLAGCPLEAGQVILTGALGPMVDVHAGDSVTTTISSIGSVSVRFSQPEGSHG